MSNLTNNAKRAAPMWVRAQFGEFGNPISFDQVSVGQTILALLPGRPEMKGKVVGKDSGRKEVVIQHENKTATLDTRSYTLYDLKDGGRRKRKTRKMKRRSLKHKK
jgi:hypothetical protein